MYLLSEMLRCYRRQVWNFPFVSCWCSENLRLESILDFWLGSWTWMSFYSHKKISVSRLWRKLKVYTESHRRPSNLCLPMARTKQTLTHEELSKNKQITWIAQSLSFLLPVSETLQNWGTSHTMLVAVQTAENQTEKLSEWPDFLSIASQQGRRCAEQTRFWRLTNQL